jgi:hypothetical protein
MHKHDRRSLCISEASTHTLITVSGQPLNLTTLRGGLTSSTASQLCQGLRYLRPNESISSAPPTLSSPLHLEWQHKANKHSWALSTLIPARTKRTTRNTTKRLHHQTPPPPLAQTAGFEVRRLQEGNDARMSPSHVQMDEVSP